MGTSRMALKRKNKKKKALRWIIGSSIVLLLVTISYGAFAFFKVKSALDHSTVNLKRENNRSELRKEDVTFSKDPVSILLLGIEDYSSKKKDGRADTQIVLTLDPNTKEMNMVTIPRDTRVKIENAGEYTGIHKINSAYTYGDITGYGAAKLQVETTEKLLNIPIDHFIAVNFEAFRDTVDALGGVTIDIKEGFWEKNIYDNKKIIFKKGKAKLSGEEALAFVRMRKRSVDVTYSRDERQRQFLKATIDQAMTAGTIFKVGQLSDILGKNIETDLSMDDLYTLQKQYSNLKSLSINSIEMKGVDQRVDNIDYYIPEEKNLYEVSKTLRNVLKLDKSKFVTNADIVQ
ncbi:LCP family protein [Rummeliibacillus pycnus]|uniref:LCP family protein n=1 Tax=Rummeliibacillus pycnus TaxID=101070 RepID=UPI000C9B4677|nr:LCP family protein [Rummeliibacillus pycnus]